MERHNISTKKEFEKVCQYLKDSLEFVEGYAKSINAKACYSKSHEWPTIEFYVQRSFNSQKGYFIDKYIFLSIDDYKYPPIYKIWVTMSNNYGFKEIFEAIRGLFKKDYHWKRLYWKKTIGYLTAPIDKVQLKDLLCQGKKELDLRKEIEEK